MRINAPIEIGDLVRYSKIMKNDSIGIVIDSTRGKPLIGVYWDTGECCYVGTQFIEIIYRN
jgi:hypothetical protein